MTVLAQSLAHYRWAAACALLLAAPFLFVSMPAMVDFGGHEAIVGVLRHRGDPAFFPPDLYVSNWGHPNQLQYLLAWPLSYLVGTTRALATVVALAVAAVILGAARLGRHLGKPAWVGMLTAPAALGWTLHLGLLANTLGLGALLLMLPELDAFARAPRWRSVPAVVAGLALLYVAHEGAMTIAMVAIALLSLAHGGRIASYVPRAAPCLVLLAAAVLQLKLQHLTPINDVHAYPVPLWRRAGAIPQVLLGYYDFQGNPTMFAVIAGAVALNAVRWLIPRAGAGAPDPAPDPQGASPLRRFVVRSRFVALGLATLVAYFVLPGAFNGVLFFYHRFFAVAWCLLVVATAPPAGAPRDALAPWVCAAVPAVMVVLLARPMLDSDASYRRLDALLPLIERDSAVFSVELDRSTLRAINDRGFSTRYAQGHIVALRGGRALSDYTQSPISPALVNPAFAWQQTATDNYLEPRSFRPALVFALFRYVVLHATYPNVLDAAVAAVDGDARLLARDKDWAIMESTILETRTLDVPEPSPKGDPGEMLSVRMHAIETAAEAKRQ